MCNVSDIAEDRAHICACRQIKNTHFRFEIIFELVWESFFITIEERQTAAILGRTLWGQTAQNL